MQYTPIFSSTSRQVDRHPEALCFVINETISPVIPVMPVMCLMPPRFLYGSGSICIDAKAGADGVDVDRVTNSSSAIEFPKPQYRNIPSCSTPQMDSRTEAANAAISQPRIIFGFPQSSRATGSSRINAESRESADGAGDIGNVANSTRDGAFRKPPWHSVPRQINGHHDGFKYDKDETYDDDDVEERLTNFAGERLCDRWTRKSSKHPSIHRTCYWSESSHSPIEHSRSPCLSDRWAVKQLTLSSCRSPDKIDVEEQRASIAGERQVRLRTPESSPSPRIHRTKLTYSSDSLVSHLPIHRSCSPCLSDRSAVKPLSLSSCRSPEKIDIEEQRASFAGGSLCDRACRWTPKLTEIPSSSDSPASSSSSCLSDSLVRPMRSSHSPIHHSRSPCPSDRSVKRRSFSCHSPDKIDVEERRVSFAGERFCDQARRWTPKSTQNPSIHRTTYSPDSSIRRMRSSHSPKDHSRSPCLSDRFSPCRPVVMSPVRSSHSPIHHSRSPCPSDRSALKPLDFFSCRSPDKIDIEEQKASCAGGRLSCDQDARPLTHESSIGTSKSSRPYCSSESEASPSSSCHLLLDNNRSRNLSGSAVTPSSCRSFYRSPHQIVVDKQPASFVGARRLCDRAYLVTPKSSNNNNSSTCSSRPRSPSCCSLSAWESVCCPLDY